MGKRKYWPLLATLAVAGSAFAYVQTYEDGDEVGIRCGSEPVVPCVNLAVDRSADAHAECGGRAACVVVAAVGKGDATTDCDRQIRSRMCGLASVSQEGQARATCDDRCYSAASAGKTGANTSMTDEGGSCLCFVMAAASVDGPAEVVLVDCFTCTPAAVSLFGDSSVNCTQCTSMTAVSGTGNSSAAGRSTRDPVTAASVGGSTDVECNCTVGLSTTALGRSDLDCGGCELAAAGSIDGDSRAYCFYCQTVVAVSGTGNSSVDADCGLGCDHVEAVSILGNASARCVPCIPIAVSVAGDAQAVCEQTWYGGSLRSCRPVAVSVFDDASASCGKCDFKTLVPHAGAAVSVFGDASSSCTGDGCATGDHVAVSGTGRASGEHAVSGCETAEGLGTSAACMRPI